MRRITTLAARGGSLALVLLVSSCGGLPGPSCTDEVGLLLATEGRVAAGGTGSHQVASPKHSNLHMRLTWADTMATLALQATITDCGEHVGCWMATLTPPPGPGGTSPTPQPWPPGLLELQVDGTRGKAYRIEVTGDSTRDRLCARGDVSDQL